MGKRNVLLRLQEYISDTFDVRIQRREAGLGFDVSVNRFLQLPFDGFDLVCDGRWVLYDALHPVAREIEHAKTCAEIGLVLLQLGCLHVQCHDARQRDLRQALNDASADLATRGGERGGRRDDAVPGETDSDLRDVVPQRIPLELWREYSALLLLHAEQRVRLLNFPVSRVVEEGAQFVAASEARRHVVCRGEERIQTRVGAPGCPRQQDRLQPLASDFAQVGDALPNGPLELFLVAGIQPAARLDGLHHQLEDVRYKLTLGRVIRGRAPASEQSGGYALEKRGSHCFLPVHERHPRAQLAPLVHASVDALRQGFCLRTRHLHLDQCTGRSAFLDQLDVLHRRERAQRRANPLLRYVVREISDNDAHR